MKRILLYMCMGLLIGACEKEETGGGDGGTDGEIIGVWESTNYQYNLIWGHINEVTGDRQQDSINTQNQPYEHYDNECYFNEVTGDYEECWRKNFYIFQYDGDFKIRDEKYLNEDMTISYSINEESHGGYTKNLNDLSFDDHWFDNVEIKVLTGSILEFEYIIDSEYEEDIPVLDEDGELTILEFDQNGQPIYLTEKKLLYHTYSYKYTFSRSE